MKLSVAIFLIVFAFIPFESNAQIIITEPYEFAVGASGGMTFSSVVFNPKVPQARLQGLTFGVTGRMTMGEYVGLQLELNYVQEGWLEDYEEFPDLTYSRRLHYLQLPFYTRVQFGGKNVKGFLNAGPQIGYFLNESSENHLNGETPGRVNNQHDMPVENRFQWGLSGGVGIEIRTGIGYFLLEGRYFYSFGDIYSTKRSDFFSKASGEVFSGKLTYLIPIRK
ncbi:MAG: PorT family protein [Tannerella sp.]|jgi:hypothetical protein|nr:PorT family protein [Tannerella sp.]